MRLPFENELAQRDVIAFMPFGSTVYGTALPTSDADYKAVFLPTRREILLGKMPAAINLKTNQGDEKNGAADVDMEMYSLHKYLDLLCQAQTVALDMLFGPVAQAPHAIWHAVLDNRTRFLSKKCGAAIGYARAQAERYSLRGTRMEALREVLEALAANLPQQDLGEVVDTVLASMSSATRGFAQIWTEEAPTLPGGKLQHLEVCGKRVGFTASVKFARDVWAHLLSGYGERAEAARTQGADWKAMYHALRIAAQTKELLTYGRITFPRPEAAFLLRVRKGELPVQEVSELIEKGLQEVLAAQASSHLPAEPDRAFVEDFLVKVYGAVVEGEL